MKLSRWIPNQIKFGLAAKFNYYARKKYTWDWNYKNICNPGSFNHKRDLRARYKCL